MEQDLHVAPPGTVVNMDIEAPTPASQAATERLTTESILEVQRAHFRVKNWGVEKTILDDVSFSACSGQLLALMGPSGAGKTTLMEFMTMSLQGGVVEGSLSLNGGPVTIDVFRKRISYVEQFDSHWALLTCWEVMQYAASLLLLDQKARSTKVDHIMSSMGLQECANTRCGNEFLKGLSGGQKKRLSLGVALLKDPSLLLLDEPTSGLDAAAAISVMGYLKELALDVKKIVVATIHQPSTQVFKSFSNVMFLANGRMAYHGSPDAIESFCSSIDRPLPEHTNPADHFIQLINSEFAGRQSVDKIVELWTERSDAFSPREVYRALTEGSQVEARRPGLFAQCGTLLKRHALLSFRDPTLYSGRMVAFLLCNSFFALIYLKARERTQDKVVPRLFLVNWMFGIVTMFAVIVVFTANVEYKMLRREIKSGITNAMSYLLATLLLPLPYMFVLSAASLLVPLYVIGNGNPDGMFLSIVVLAVCLWGFEASAQLLAVVVDNPLVGALCSINLWVTSFLFCGLFLQPEFVIWPFRVFNSIFPLGWTMKAMQYLDMHGSVWQGAVAKPGGGFECPDFSPIECYGTTGDEVLDSLSNTFPVEAKDTVATDIQFLLCYGAFWKVLQLAVVLLKGRYAFRAPSPRKIEC